MHANIFSIINRILILLFLLVALEVQAQQKISVNAENQPLSEIFSRLSDQYSLRFAYDEDIFSKIYADLHFSNRLIDNFLTEICSKYGLNYKLIAGTYVFFIDDNLKIMEAIQNSKPIVEKRDTLDLVSPSPRAIEYTVSGEIRNTRTGEPLRYCEVEVNGQKRVISNEMGFFSTTLFTEGEIRFRIERLGYYQLDTTLQIESSVPLQFELKPHPIIDNISLGNLKPIQFTIQVPEGSEVAIFEPSKTLQAPGAESNDLVAALTVLPGINYLKGNDTGLSIRGGASSDNLVLLDGIPLIETNHLMGNLSVLNAKYIEQAYVSRGGFSVEYGGRTAGIVDLLGKTGSTLEPLVDVTANLLHTNIYVGAPINKKSSLSGSFKKSFVDVWPGYLIENFVLENKQIEVDDNEKSDAVIDNTKVDYSDINLKVSILPAAGREMNFNLFRSTDKEDRSYTFNNEGSFYQRNLNDEQSNGYSFNYKMQSHRAWLNTFSLAHSSIRHFSQSENGKEQMLADELVKTFYNTKHINIREAMGGWKSELTHSILSHKFGLGFNYYVLDNFYEDHEVKMTGANNFNDSISNNASTQILNSYYQLTIFPLKWLKVRGGVRGIHNVAAESTNLQARYGLEIYPFRNMQISYAGGRYIQHLYLTNRFNSYKNASPYWYLSNTGDDFMDAFHHIVGFKINESSLSINLEAYQKRNLNKMYYFGRKGISSGFNVVDYSQYKGEELNRGIDFFVQYRTGIFKHQVSYSLSESRDRIDGLNNNEYFDSFDHQLHRLRISEMVKFRNWTASFNWQYASGLPFISDLSTANNLIIGQLPSYSQFDFSLVKQFDFKLFYADIGVTVLNVLNHENHIHVKNFSLIEGKQEYKVRTSTSSTAFSPLFFINFRYE